MSSSIDQTEQTKINTESTTQITPTVVIKRQGVKRKIKSGESLLKRKVNKSLFQSTENEVTIKPKQPEIRVENDLEGEQSYDFRDSSDQTERMLMEPQNPIQASIQTCSAHDESTVEPDPRTDDDLELEFNSDESTSDNDFGIEEIPIQHNPQINDAVNDNLIEMSRTEAVDDRSDTTPLVSFQTINAPHKTYSQKYKRHIIKSEFKFNHNLMDLKDLPPINDDIDNAFEEAIKSMIKNVPLDSKISVSIDNDKLTKNIYLPPVEVSSFDKQSFLNRISMTYQSNKEFILDGVLKVTVYILENVKGSAHTTALPETYENKRVRKNSIIKIENTDNSCGLRALWVGKTWCDLNNQNETTPQWQRVYWNRERTFRDGARSLALKFNISLLTPLTIEIIASKIQPVWSGQYQIFVIDGITGELLFRGPENSDKHIFILWTKKQNEPSGHYDVIKKIWCLFNKRKWCQFCYKFFNTTARHFCPGGCYTCRAEKPCIEDTTSQSCDSCGRKFLNISCYNNHIANQLCKEIHFCNECEVNYRVDNKDPHECDVFKCQQCRERYSVQPHYCKLKKHSLEKLVEEDEVPKIINVFDIESMLIKEENREKHTPNLVCSMTICDNCAEEKQQNSEFICIFCGEFYKVFKGDGCVNSFSDYITDTLAQKAKNMGGHVLSIAHNFSGYDGAFIFKALLESGMCGLKPILNGSKLMKIDVGNVRFIDSYLFFQLSLGYFPHHMNTPENQSMTECSIKDIPEKQYGIDTMTEKQVSEFKVWYNKQVEDNYIFEFWPELEKYCKNDVQILLSAVIRFKNYFKQITQLDPITRCFTLPSVGLEYFRAHHLEDDAIIVTPTNGFRNNRKQSVLAKCWIDWNESRFIKKPLIREYHIGPYYVDAMLPEEYVFEGHNYKMLALEFDGCYWHGCTTCGEETDAQKVRKLKRADYFKKRNIHLVVQKECEFKRTISRVEFEGDQIDEDDRFLEFIKLRQKFHTIIDKNDLYVKPRDALHGGRVNNIKFFGKSFEGDTLQYYDFTSLYPWVLKNHSFPMRDPVNIHDFKLENGNIKDYNGLISCKVLPPRRLRFPVLPFNCNNKLMFPLCRTCAIEQNHGDCRHNVKQRAFRGIFTSIELHKAVDRGYKILSVYEITHFNTWSSDVFVGYINKWYKIKAEASGWPKNVQTREQQDAWIEMMREKEGIEIEIEKVQFNPGLRFIAKLMLNSLWGKLAQRPNRPQTRVVRNYSELWQLFNDERLEILGEYTIDDMILVSFRFLDDYKAPAGQTCSAIAAFVTAYARLKLLDEIEKIEKGNPGSVLYFNTDSIVFKHKEGCYKPTVGNYLGEMTDEIVEEFGLGAKMLTFYTTGPKSYCYKVSKPINGTTDIETVYKMKAKGLTQIYGAKEVLNPVTLMKHAVLKARNMPCEPDNVPQYQFRRHPKKGFTVTTDYMTKVFKNTSNKRRIIGNDTVPFGFQTTEFDPIDWSKIGYCKKWSNKYGWNLDKTCDNVKCRKCVKRTEKCDDMECKHPDCVSLYHFHRWDYVPVTRL